jgi:hypothetical protein
MSPRRSFKPAVGAALAIPGMAVVLAIAGTTPAQAAGSPGWRVVAKVAVKNAFLDDVVALRGGTAWVSGGSATSTPVLYHLTGGKWHLVTRPGPPSSFAGDLAATSTSNVWTVIANAAAVDHWNGHTWKRTSFGSPLTLLVNAVTTTGPNDTWVFLYLEGPKVEVAVHYNGKSWIGGKALPAQVDGDGSHGLASASSRSNVWTWALKSGKWTTMHYDGKSWKIVSLPAHLVKAGYFFGPTQILALSSSNVWATADVFKGKVSGPVVLLHWDGHSWRKVTGKLPAGTLTGSIARDGHGGLWLGGQSPGGKPFFAHYLQGTWTTVAQPSDVLGAIKLSALALIPRTQSMLGVGTAFTGLGTNGAAIFKYGK